MTDGVFLAFGLVDRIREYLEDAGSDECTCPTVGFEWDERPKCLRCRAWDVLADIDVAIAVARGGK